MRVRWSRLSFLGVGGALGLALALVLVLSPRRLVRPATLHRVATEPVPSEDEVARARERLARFERERRLATDFSHLPPANLSHGADPYALARLDSAHVVGVLRGASALVLLDNELHELQRVDVPGSLVSVVVSGSGECWVAGETTRELTRFRLDRGRLLLSGRVLVPGVVGIRALAVGASDLLYALDVHDGKLLTLEPGRVSNPVQGSRIVGHGPLSLRRVGAFLIVNVLLDHAIVVYELGPGGRVLRERTRVQHDGPFWGFDAKLLDDGQLVIAATGVEDHPLDRSDGSFGYIDSFAFGYVLPKRGALRELFRTNVSELGVVTPKAPVLDVAEDTARLFVSGYGSDPAVELGFDVRGASLPHVESESFVPGTCAGIELGSGQLAFADPLLDAWVLRTAAKATVPATLRAVTSTSAPLSTTEERLGEALFFTTLMAPANSSQGSHSRFTCETCHFEGYVDGRVHYTGREDVHVATKPLRGLFNNRPHFSRALDPDLATVSHHEFRVAGKGNGQDPWAELRLRDFPWLEQLSVHEPVLGPEALRRALITFLMRFSHTTNPAVVGRTHFDENEQRGAEHFREHCAGCHAPRLQSDLPDSALTFDAWQPAIFSPEGAIVWASAEYQKTGVLPYVHEAGTRVPSLRRLYTKWPHFTNGSADTVLDVARRARFDGTRFFHEGAPDDSSLRAFSAEQAADLAAFLELL